MGRDSIIEFRPVTQRHDKIIIVCSGPTALGFKPIPGWTVIAVNNAISITKEHTDYWFTLDPSVENYGIMKNKPFDCYYYAALPIEYGTSSSKDRTGLWGVLSGVHYLRRLSDPNSLHGLLSGLSFDPSCVHTGNSAYGALNLALHMHPSRIIIIGLDANKEAKIDGTRSRSLNHLPSLFESSLNDLNVLGIDVLNASKYSKVTCFERKHFDKVLNDELCQSSKR